jgi:hypothetical protein
MKYTLHKLCQFSFFKATTVRLIMLTAFTLAVAVSCAPKEEKPELLLSEKQMISLLIDMHIVEGQAYSLNVSMDSSKVLTALLGNEVLKKHNINEAVFLENYNYYLLRENQMRMIYRAVLDSLNLKQKIQNFE